jgi:hypothetical protein
MMVEIDACRQSWPGIMKTIPTGYDANAYWNFLIRNHLEVEGFGLNGRRQPYPVIVPLPVGQVLLFHSWTVHAGMGRPKVGLASIEGFLRWHMYWARLTTDEKAPEYNTIDLTRPSASYFYPAWYFL